MQQSNFPIPYTPHSTLSRQRGFTLVEMIVSVFIFTVVMLIAVGALVTVMDANRRAQANKAVMNNLHFALESMTREVRVGSAYVDDADVTDFEFTDKDGIAVRYSFSEIGGVGQILRSKEDVASGVDIPLTAPEVDINTLEFYVYGTDTDDATQPHVIIIVRGIAGQTERTMVPFNLQTVITQRFLDR